MIWQIFASYDILPHMNVLVTGGAGFIASNIVDAYVAQGHRVTVVDNMWHGFKRNLNPKAKFVKADIRNLAAMRRVVEQTRPAIINHHAAIAEVVRSVTDPLSTIEVNVQGTINLLLAGGEFGIKKFIFASTGGAIYGEAKHRPTPETVVPRPLSPYGLSKLLGEECISYYARMYGFDYFIFRYPNVYGPRQDPHGEAGVVAIFSELLSSNHTATIFGTGKKTRDYVYVKDIVRANVLALRKGKNVTVNLGRGVEISDLAVYQTIKHHFPQAPAVRYKKVRAGEVMRSCLNAKLAKTVLSWQPQWTFKAGVADYLATMRYV